MERQHQLCRQLAVAVKRLERLIDRAQENRVRVAAHELVESDVEELAEIIDELVGWMETAYPDRVIKRDRGGWVLTLDGAGMLLARLEAMAREACGDSGRCIEGLRGALAAVPPGAAMAMYRGACALRGWDPREDLAREEIDTCMSDPRALLARLLGARGLDAPDTNSWHRYLAAVAVLASALDGLERLVGRDAVENLIDAIGAVATGDVRDAERLADALCAAVPSCCLDPYVHESE
jgi:hypothetical protein